MLAAIHVRIIISFVTKNYAKELHTVLFMKKQNSVYRISLIICFDDNQSLTKRLKPSIESLDLSCAFTFPTYFGHVISLARER